jgi:hypothetical protein
MGINKAKPSLADQARAMGFAGRMSAGGVLFPTAGPGREWVTWLTSQLWAFHGLGGQVDDGVDACSIFARGLDDVYAGKKPPVEPDQVPEPFTEAWFKKRDQMRANTDTVDATEFYN